MENKVHKNIPSKLLETGTNLYRIQHGTYKNQLQWSKNNPKNRFDHEQTEILYTSASFNISFLESIASNIHQPVSKTRTKKYNLFTLKNLRNLNLADLTGHNLRKIGLTADIAFTTDYSITSTWSKEIFTNNTMSDGIYYHSRHDPNEYNVALFDRAKDKISIATVENLA